MNIIIWDKNDSPERVKPIYREYLKEMNALFTKEMNLSFEIDRVLEASLMQISGFTPPEEFVLLAEMEEEIVGCVGLKKLSNEIGELKKFFVLRQYRRQGIAKLLLQKVIHLSREIGYQKIRLDCPNFAKNAQKLYKSFGFQLIPPYPEVEISSKFHQSWLFMELSI